MARRRHRRETVIRLRALTVALVMLLLSASAFGQAFPVGIDVRMDKTNNPEDVALSLQILALLTVLGLAPSILMLTTSFTRIVIVLSFVRRALGTQQTPSNQILVGLALFLTFFTMAPVWDKVYENALHPYLTKEIQSERRTVTRPDGNTESVEVTPFEIMVERLVAPVREFMWGQLGENGENDVALFLYLAQQEPPKGPDDVALRVLVPAYVISELKKSFIIGFIIFIPFLVIDLVTASVLMSMGMIMLPPVVISLPFKLLLFVMVDGWNLLVRALGLSILNGAM